MVLGRDSFSVGDTYVEADPKTLRLPLGRPAEKLTVFVSTNLAYCRVSENENGALPDPENPDELRLNLGFNTLVFAVPITAVQFRCAKTGLLSGIDYYRLYGYR